MNYYLYSKKIINYIVLKLRYFQVGGTPEHVIELLSKNYIGVAQMANMVAEWLILGGIHFYLLSNILKKYIKYYSFV